MATIVSLTPKPSEPSGTKLVDSAEKRLHVMHEPLRVHGLYYARCSCGFVTEGKDSRHRALTSECAVEQAQLVGLRNEYWFQRACRLDW